ncbi:MAG: ABC transporter substrate-binding protein [Anaerolineales bacterium]|nr:ABC transporter substrate-binding protein [Anaerolineales bacterium]
MQRKTILFSLLLISGLLLSACGGSVPGLAPRTETIRDAFGREVTLSGTPQRIISLAPSVTEMLFAVDAGGQVVGRDSYSDYPEEVQGVIDIGDGFSSLNTELILSLEPDLILAAEITSLEQISQLEDLGLSVFVVPNPLDFEELYQRLELVAHLTGHDQAVGQLVGSLKERVAAVDKTLADIQGRPLVFYELDGTDPNAPWTSGPGTFVDMIITRAGGQNLAGSMDGQWVQVSLEVLVMQDPDLILLGSAHWGGVTPEDVSARAGWETLTAVQDGRVYTFDDNTVSRPGPRLVDGYEAMAKQLHPELFR